MSLKIKQKDADFVVMEVENGGFLGSKRGLNLPRAVVDLYTMSERDIQDLSFGVQHCAVFACFIYKAADIHEVGKVWMERKEGKR